MKKSLIFLLVVFATGAELPMHAGKKGKPTKIEGITKPAKLKKKLFQKKFQKKFYLLIF